MAVLFAAGCGGDDGPDLAPTTSAPYSQTDLVVGTGTVAASGNLVTVAYTGWLHDSSRPDAKARSSRPAHSSSGLVLARSFVAGTRELSGCASAVSAAW